MIYIKLFRIKHWIKNLFLFIPLFFAGDFLHIDYLLLLSLGFVAFGFVASGVYIMNDYRDIEADRKHPEKCNRPLASGLVSKRTALLLMALCFLLGILVAVLLGLTFAFILLLYLFINLAYSFGLKHVAILDVMLVSLGFVLRVKAGGILAEVYVSEWLTVMVYLLALFMAFAKRRDDVLLKLQFGVEMRKASMHYNLEFINAVIILLSTITVVAYIMYTVSPVAIERLGTDHLYLTSIFVIAGILRYLQLIYVNNDGGHPTNLLYRDRFIQISIVLWMLSFYIIIYLPDWQIF